MGIFHLFVDAMKQFLTYCFDVTQFIGYPSYGIAIILLTLIIKTVFAPLTVKQVRSMKGMQKIQPKMKEIQARYKNDPKKLQEELGKLYKDAGVNPLSGCLPLLIQMPFLFAIFYALREYPYEHAYASFLWLKNLGTPDPYYILPVISAISTFLVSKQTSTGGGEGAAAMQAKIMTYGMPLFIGYVSIHFPSGLVIYWAISNFYQVVQQWYIFRGDKE